MPGLDVPDLGRSVGQHGRQPLAIWCEYSPLYVLPQRSQHLRGNRMQGISAPEVPVGAHADEHRQVREECGRHDPLWTHRRTVQFVAICDIPNTQLALAGQDGKKLRIRTENRPLSRPLGHD